jgi:predicted transcriptional regulator
VSEELMTRREVAAMLGVTSQAVSQWVRRRVLPEVRGEDGEPRYRRADVEELHHSAQQAGLPGVVQVRLMGDAGDIRRVRELLAAAGAEVLTASGARVNRRDPGVRVHLTVRLPGGDDR